jgi:hypothetical protein
MIPSQIMHTLFGLAIVAFLIYNFATTEKFSGSSEHDDGAIIVTFLYFSRILVGCFFAFGWRKNFMAYF